MHFLGSVNLFKRESEASKATTPVVNGLKIFMVLMFCTEFVRK